MYHGSLIVVEEATNPPEPGQCMEGEDSGSHASRYVHSPPDYRRVERAKPPARALTNSHISASPVSQHSPDQRVKQKPPPTYLLPNPNLPPRPPVISAYYDGQRLPERYWDGWLPVEPFDGHYSPRVTGMVPYAYPVEGGYAYPVYER